MNNVGMIVLAAGSSSRLGSPKQLLAFKDKPMILHVADEAWKAKLHPVVVITGANAEAVTAVLNMDRIVVVYNEYWREGMASGIVAGVNAILSIDSKIPGLIISVCDQPYLSAALFQQMIDKQVETRKGIVSCAYAGTRGTPGLFTQKYFSSLQQLKGEEGAKKILKLYPDDVVTVDFPQGDIDIDTMEDYEKLVG